MVTGYQSCASTTLKTFLTGIRPEVELMQMCQMPTKQACNVFGSLSDGLCKNTLSPVTS